MKKYAVTFSNNYGQVALIVEALDQEGAINTAIGLKWAPRSFWNITAALNHRAMNEQSPK